MGDKERGAGFPEALIEKRQYPVLEIQKAFSVRGPECVQVLAPLLESFRILLFDLIEPSAVPLSQVDFIQGRIGDD